MSVKLKIKPFIHRPIIVFVLILFSFCSNVSGSPLHVYRTKSESPKGTIILLPGGGYKVLNIKSEAAKLAKFLNTQSFDVAILEYHIGIGSEAGEIAINDILKAYRLIRTNFKSLKLCDNRIILMGISSGGYLAACTVNKLSNNEQPADLILISPAKMDEYVPGTVYKSVMPPVDPSPRLLLTIPAAENKSLITSCQEYSKTWIGYDGQATFCLLADSAWIAGAGASPVDKKFNLARIIKTFLDTKSDNLRSEKNPAGIPVKGYSSQRHQEKLALVAKEKFDLIMIGNSITNNFEKPEYQPVWNEFFAHRNALNLGYSGYRTENIIWNIENGELDGQSPKVIVLEIGTNNVDEKNDPTRHTAGQLAGGIKAIVSRIREKLPDTKIIVLRCFPGCYGGPNPTSHRAILERASDIVSGIADGKHIFYCDVNKVFLNHDGSINHDMMPDWLHPGPEGAKAWALEMEPLLSKLMGDYPNGSISTK